MRTQNVKFVLWSYQDATMTVMFINLSALKKQDTT